MKYWPGNEVFPAGDNPPWNMFEMKTFGLSLEDDGSEGDVPTSEMLKGWMEPPGESYLYNGYGSNIIRLKTDLTRIYNLYGSVVEFGSKMFSDPSARADHNLYHRIHLLSGLAAENKTGDPTSFGLSEVPELIDNQPVGAAATTLTTPAVSYGAGNTGLIEVGFQCGKEFNGQYYPQVVDAIAVVSDQANVLMNCSIYKSYDGMTWFMVPKAQYNSNGWVNGEYLISNAWRIDEVGAGTESARVFAFATPQLGCYFKIVYNNAAGKTLVFNEIYGFNHQGEIGFTTDLVNYRYVKALKKGNQLLFNLKDAPIIRIGSGPIGPSGQRATLDEDTGIWRDFGVDAWYDKGRWIRPDGKVWIEPTPFASGKWVTPAASLGAISVMDIAASRETLQTCRQIMFCFRPFACNPALMALGLSVKLFSVYISTSQVDTYDSEGRKTNTMRFPSTAGQIGPAIPFRIYNNGNQTSRGLEVWADTQAVRAKTKPEIKAGNGDVLSMLITEDNGEQVPDWTGVWEWLLTDESHGLFDMCSIAPMLNKALSGLGSYRDHAFEIRSIHKKDDEDNVVPDILGDDISDAVTWCSAWHTAFNAHIASEDYHEHADNVNNLMLTPPGDVLADVVAYVNEARDKFNAHVLQYDGTAHHVHGLGVPWSQVDPSLIAEDTGDYTTSHVKALCNALYEAYNLRHVEGNMQGYIEKNITPPGWLDPGYYKVLATKMKIAVNFGDGKPVLPTGLIYHYASPGSAICELSATGSDPWIRWPNILTHPSGTVPSKSFTTVYARANLMLHTEEIDRHTKIIARYNY